MSRRNKLEKFAQLLTFSNVYQNYYPRDPKLQWVSGKVVDRKGKWRADHFKGSGPLILELACGGGEYTLDMARSYPGQFFMGVDVKGNRIWKGARKALQEEISNAAFLRTRIEQLDLFFEENEIDQIWITFPDPFLRKSKANRRLTSPLFLETYKKLLKPEGVVHLKTDSPELYEYTLETLEEENIEIHYADDDIYSKPLPIPELEIKTYYEKMHLEAGKTIKYVRFGFF